MEDLKQLYVLIACEESQTECIAFRRLGHIAFSCDIQKCNVKGNADWHIVGDVRPYLQGKKDFVTQSGHSEVVPRWDLIIAHPPCTFLCKLSAVQLHKNPNFMIKFNGKNIFVNGARYANMLKARKFFMECLYAKASYVAVENPCPMKLARLPKADFFACPSWFGFKYTKKTYYWVKNLPPLMANFVNPTTKCLVSCTRGKYRSRTAVCLAEAIAKQWSEYIISKIN